MITRNTLLAAMMVLPLAAAIHVSDAVAQEAITLETIGAVRMASPDDVKRMNDEASRLREQMTKPATASKYHAAFTE